MTFEIYNMKCLTCGKDWDMRVIEREKKCPDCGGIDFENTFGYTLIFEEKKK